MCARCIRLVRPALGAKLANRAHPDIPPSRVRTDLLWAIRKQRAASRFTSSNAYFAWEAEQTARRILRHGFGNANAFYGYVRNAHPNVYEAARDHSLVTFADQAIAPALIEQREQTTQIERFGDWIDGQQPADDLSIIDELEQATWPLADRIVCASQYVADSLAEVGVNPEKVTVIHSPIDSRRFTSVDRSGRSGPLVVGFVGEVGLRKGAPYFLQVAKRLAGESLRFVMVGKVRFNAKIQAEYAPYVDFIGPVPPTQVQTWLGRFDMMLFPSTCEGSAYSLIEAMATGLPVVTSPNSGSLVTHGKVGYIHPYDAVDALAASVEQLASDDALRQTMAHNARQCTLASNMDAYSGHLKALTTEALQHPATGKTND